LLLSVKLLPDFAIEGLNAKTTLHFAEIELSLVGLYKIMVP